MQITLNLLKDFDAYKLFTILRNRKHELRQESFEHVNMISLLEGNDQNDKAQSKLEAEKHCLRMINEEVATINNLLTQLEPIVDEILRRQREENDEN